MVAILTLGLLERNGGLVCSLVVLVDKLWGRWLLCLVGTHTWLLEWTVSHVLDVVIQELRVSKHVTLISIGSCLRMRPPRMLVPGPGRLVLSSHVLFILLILRGLQQWDVASDLSLRTAVLESM